MKKRKLRESIKGQPLEWPKYMSSKMVQQLDGLPGDIMVTIVCSAEDPSVHAIRDSLLQTRKQTHQREVQWQPLKGALFVIKATLRFIQCFLWQSNATAINLALSSRV